MTLVFTIVLVLYCALALVSVFYDSTTVAVISYSAMSSATFFLYYAYNAADVALTEIAIGMFLTFFFFYIVHFKTYTHAPEHKKMLSTIFIGFCTACIFGILLYMAYLLENISLTTTYSEYYNKNTYEETHVPNTITAILASYRGFDTLGETLIIATSSLGIATILKGKRKK